MAGEYGGDKKRRENEREGETDGERTQVLEIGTEKSQSDWWPRHPRVGTRRKVEENSCG